MLLSKLQFDLSSLPTRRISGHSCSHAAASHAPLAAAAELEQAVASPVNARPLHHCVMSSPMKATLLLLNRC